MYLSIIHTHTRKPVASYLIQERFPGVTGLWVWILEYVFQFQSDSVTQQQCLCWIIQMPCLQQMYGSKNEVLKWFMKFWLLLVKLENKSRHSTSSIECARNYKILFNL